MIKINLLPQEFRRKDGPSFRVIGATALGALLVSGCLATFAYIWFGRLAEVERFRASLEDDLHALEPQAAYDDLLREEKAEFAQREKTIKEIRQKRVLWTGKLDQFADLVNNNGDDERHLCWFDNIEVKPGKSGFEVGLAGHCAGSDVARVANFLDDVVEHDFFVDFTGLSEPSGRLELSQKNVEPKESVTFPLKMVLQPGSGAKAAPARK